MLSLATPWLLLALPLPWFLRRFVKPAAPKNTAFLRVPFFTRLASLQTETSHSGTLKNYKHYVAYLIWVLLVWAASGPQWIGEPIPLPQSGRNIMLVVDLSGSMRLPDFSQRDKTVTRLDVVKTVGRQFIASRTGDRLGLVLFGSRAYLQTPLTFDRKTVANRLDDASIGLAGDSTAIGDAVGIAVKRLMQVPKRSRVIVLLTDGGNNSGALVPLQAATLAKQAGIKIYTVGLGADHLMVQTLLGPREINPSSDLDQETLQKMADMTGGLYFRAKDTAGLEQAYRTLDQVEPVVSGAAIFRPTQDLFYWPLSLAFILGLLLIYALCKPCRQAFSRDF